MRNNNIESTQNYDGQKQQENIFIKGMIRYGGRRRGIQIGRKGAKQATKKN